MSDEIDRKPLGYLYMNRLEIEGASLKGLGWLRRQVRTPARCSLEIEIVAANSSSTSLTSFVTSGHHRHTAVSLKCLGWMVMRNEVKES